MAKKAKTEEVVEAEENMNDGDVQEVQAPKESKSIVPARYAGKYKNGGSDALSEFIKAQCGDDKGAFSFDKFFQLCRANGIAEEQVAKYEGQVNEKRNGAPGRARMTLRNMLATKVRKDGKLQTLEGADAEVTLPKVASAPKAAAEGVEGSVPAF
jgi:hypothetical protein